MRALTVRPGDPESLAVAELPDPRRAPDEVLVRGLSLGICGTDHEIVAGTHGAAPPGSDFLVLGHESLGEVAEVPDGAALRPGDLVAGIVRRPDPVPCECCARGRWDMCRNGLFTERGIKERHGFASELWTEEESYLVDVDDRLRDVGVLVEPASVVAKAWATIDGLVRERCGDAAVVAVTGAGPVGLLAALMARRRGFEVHVVDLVEGGPKPDLVRGLGATYHSQPLARVVGLRPDVVIECTGVADVFVDALGATRRNGIVCLLGVSAPKSVSFDAGRANAELVLENDVVFGSVNAARDHYTAAAEALVEADPAWLASMITRRVPLSDAPAAFTPHGDVKVALDLTR